MNNDYDNECFLCDNESVMISECCNQPMCYKHEDELFEYSDRICTDCLDEMSLHPDPY
jgi:hypothetical protein